MVTLTRRLFQWSDMSWSAIMAGVLTSLIVQILLTMLGIGVGLISVDTYTASAAPLGVSWAAFLWWAAAGLIAAFAGGYVAAMAAKGLYSGPAHALMAWSLAVILVVGAAAFTAGTTASLASNLAGPTAAGMARLNALSEAPRARVTTGQAAATNEIEAARKAVAQGMLASFVALLIGGFVAFAGGLSGEKAARPSDMH